ncbi:uncharacterized protein LOC126671223 [Mercurialis annua]|uniref:uncharacterized protein LOC126671223 n=1 Tax=Mercurialis annua TaxID=3986 RepID=UPI0024AD74E1|nr:uncharacterized protein LOC126671223 [Mercurialis annua]
MATTTTNSSLEGVKRIDATIARKKMVADDSESSENMDVYDCVYRLCTTEPKIYGDALYEKHLNVLKERVTKKVCERLYGKIQEAAMSLIIEEREGGDIDRNLLCSVFNLFLGLEGNGTANYYDKLELAMLAEAAAYYSELSMEWWFWRDSYTNYMWKVDWCLAQEEARAEGYLCQRTKAKLLDVVKYILLERNAKRWVQKQKAEVVAADNKELISKYASLILDVGTSASSKNV